VREGQRVQGHIGTLQAARLLPKTEGPRASLPSSSAAPATYGQCGCHHAHAGPAKEPCPVGLLGKPSPPSISPLPFSPMSLLFEPARHMTSRGVDGALAGSIILSVRKGFPIRPLFSSFELVRRREAWPWLVRSSRSCCPGGLWGASTFSMDTPRAAGRAPIRVLLLHRDLTYHGGVSRSFLTAATSIDRERVNVEIASMQQAQAEMRHSFGKLSVPVHVIGDRAWVLPTLRLRSILVNRRIDLAVCGSLRAYLTAKAASCGSETPVIFWLPGIQSVISGRLRRLVFRALSSNDALIFTSRAVQRAHSFPRHVGAEYVLPNGVSDPLDKEDTAPYDRGFRANLNIPHNACVIGYTAEFVEVKDHGTLLDAFQLVLRRHPNAHLILIGAGRLLDAMTRKAAAIDPAGHVHLLGPRLDARRLLGIMDIYAHPCMSEGFGLAVVEAMLAGVPVAAANGGALPEIVEHGVTGLLFRPQDSVDLAGCISRLVLSPRVFHQISLAARAYSLRAFSPRLFCERLEAILRQEVSKNRSRPGRVSERKPPSWWFWMRVTPRRGLGRRSSRR